MSDDSVAEFINVTQASPEVAAAFLAKAGGNLELAVAQFLSADEPGERDAGREAERGSGGAFDAAAGSRAGSRPASNHSSSSALHRAPRHRFSTFSEMTREQAAPALPAGADGDDPAQFFTGGEKSGLAVTNPNDPHARGASPGSLVDQIIRKAQQRGAQEDVGEREPAADAGARAAFHGRGFRLGQDAAPSAAAPSPQHRQNAPAFVQSAGAESSDDGSEDDDAQHPILRRTLYFWRDGFSIDDGPLYRFDDPQNEVYLRAITMGRAPVELLKVKPHQAVDVRIEQRPTEDYVKPRVEPSLDNSGPGQRLGSVPPVSPAPQPAAEPAAPARVASAAGGLGSQGDAAVQLRLADGSVHRLRFESSAPVQQLYDFAEAAAPSRGRAFVLQTPMPPVKLEDRAASLKSAGAVGAVIVQRWL